MTKKIISIVLVLTTLFTIGSFSFTADAATTKTVFVSADKYSGTTRDKFYFYASTNFSAKKVTLKVDNSSTIYNMTSYRYSSNKNWASPSISLSKGKRTISIRAYYENTQYIIKTLTIQVTKPIILTLSVSANKYFGMTDDSFDFYATTNLAATKVNLKFDNNSTTYSMNSSDKKNWSLCGNQLSAGNRTITITAYSSDGQPVTKKLSITVKTVFLQNDPLWADVPYGYKNEECTEPATISSSGCGLLSITNAVYYLTGKFIEPKDLAELSLNNGYRVNGVGTARAFAEFVASKYGNSCGFKFAGESYSDSALIDHLKSGGVSVAVVPYHFVAMVAYDVSSDKILVLDSAPGLDNRPYTSATWIKSSELKSGCFKTEHYSFFSSAASNSPITPVPTSLTLSVSANKYSGTTNDSFDFYATTNFVATKVNLKFNNNSTTYSMSSSDKKNWSLCGNHLSAGNRTVTITAYSDDGQTITKTLNVTVTETAYPSRGISVNYAYYSDVPRNHWSNPYISAAKHYELMQGVGNNEFHPNEPIKHAHFVSVVNKIKYVVNSSNYNNISRTEAVRLIWQAAGSPTWNISTDCLNNYSDNDKTPDKYAWAWCIQNGIINGDNGRLKPMDCLSRAEAAALLVRAYCIIKLGFRVTNINVIYPNVNVKDSIISINGVRLYEYPLGSTVPSNSYYFNVNGNSTYVAATQCYGYACYVQMKLYGSCWHTNGSHFQNLSGSSYLSAYELSADKLKELITRAGVGAHLRVGPSGNSPGHSMIIADFNSNGFTVIDANAYGNCTVDMRTYTWQGYLNSSLGQRGIDWIEVHT